MTDDTDRDEAIADLRADVAQLKAAIEQLVKGFGSIMAEHASAIVALRVLVQVLGLSEEQIDAAFDASARIHDESSERWRLQREMERLTRLLESARSPKKSH